MRRFYPVLIIIAFSMCIGAVVFAAPKRLTIGTWKTQQTITPYFYNMYLPKTYTADVRPFTNPGDQKTALLAGSLDICGTTIVQAIKSASQGEPVVLVAPMSNKCSALVVARKSSITRIADLKGKRIGYVPNTMHHILLLELLAKAGIKQSQVKLLRVDFFDMKNALAGGQIDAFLSGEPYPTIAKVEGVGRILAYPYQSSIGTINSAMMVSRNTIKTKPKMVQALVTAHYRATGYLAANPEVWIKQSAKLGNSPSVLKKAAKNISLQSDFDKNYIKNTKALAQQMLQLKMIKRMPDIDAMFDMRFLSAAKKADGQ